MSSPSRKERVFAEREEEILDAALALCSTPQWEAVTVGDIAARAGIGKGTVYTHFASKDELLFRLMMRFYRGLLGLLREEAPPASARERVRRSVEHALRYHSAERRYRYIVQYCERADFKERAGAHWREDLLALDRAFQIWAKPILECGMACGEIAPRPPAELMIGIRAAFQGAVAMLWSGPQWCPLGDDEETLIAAVSEFVVAALAGGGTPPPAPS